MVSKKCRSYGDCKGTKTLFSPNTHARFANAHTHADTGVLLLHQRYSLSTACVHIFHGLPRTLQHLHLPIQAEEKYCHDGEQGRCNRADCNCNVCIQGALLCFRAVLLHLRRGGYSRLHVCRRHCTGSSGSCEGSVRAGADGRLLEKKRKDDTSLNSLSTVCTGSCERRVRPGRRGS